MSSNVHKLVLSFLFDVFDCLTLFSIFGVQPVFSPSVLAEMMRPDGSSTIPVLSGESLSAELAHEIMSIQVSF